MQLIIILLLFFFLPIWAIDPNDPKIQCGGESCKIDGVRKCPLFKEYNTDQDIFRNYVIDGIIYVKDTNYLWKDGGTAHSFFPTEPGDYVIVHSDKIHDTGLVIDMKSINDDSYNAKNIKFHSFSEDGPQLPYATDDDNLLLTTATMSKKHNKFLTFNLYTRYVNGVVPRIKGLKKQNKLGEGVEFCLRGFGLVQYNHNHDDSVKHTNTKPDANGHWIQNAPVGSVNAVEDVRDNYEFGTLDLQFESSIVVEDELSSLEYEDLMKLSDGIYLAQLKDSEFEYDSYTTQYEQKFHRPPDYKKVGLYYKGADYKGKYPLLSLQPGSSLKKNMIVEDKSGKVVGCYVYNIKPEERGLKFFTGTEAACLAETAL